jgi:lipoprotein-releasing system permease protein
MRLRSRPAWSLMYKLFLTVRYLTRRPLSIVAVLALTLSVFALVIAPSVMNGFQEEFHKKIRGTLSDMTMASSVPFALSDDAEVTSEIAAIPGVTAVAPYIENPALDKHFPRKIDYCFMRGVDPYREKEVSSFEKYFLSDREVYLALNDWDRASEAEKKELERDADRYTLATTVDHASIYRQLVEGSPEAKGVATCAVGIYYLKAWDLQVALPGDPSTSQNTITLTTASQQGEVSEDKKFRIVAAFRTGFSENDRRQVITSLASLQSFIGVPHRISGWSIHMANYEDAPKVKQALIRAWHGGGVVVPVDRLIIQTWEERNQTLLRAVAMEKLLIRIITFLIVVAAAASMILVLFMTVQSKVRELGILRAVGATRAGVFSLFVGQGFLIAFLSMAFGLGLGILGSLYINEVADAIYRTTGWHPFPPDVYYLERIPTKIVPGENLFNFVAVMLLGSFAAVLPGFIAAMRPPLRAIRND